MKRKTDVKFLTMTGRFIGLRGIIKNGLDTSRLINLIICFESPEEFRMEDFPVPQNLFYINDLSFSEALGILIHEFDMSEKTAKRKILDWVDKFSLQRIRYDIICESYEEVVRQANLKVVGTKGESYRIGDSDIKIISGFLKEKVNIVHARDKGLEETCKELGLNVVPTPKKDTDKENSLKRSLK